jgi:hypothetical protein
MAKEPQKSDRTDEIELHPDAWERFAEFVKRIAKAGPQHRAKKESLDERKRPERGKQKRDFKS